MRHIICDLLDLISETEKDDILQQSCPLGYQNRRLIMQISPKNMADKIQRNTVEKLGDDYSKNYGMFSRFCLSNYMIMFTQHFLFGLEKGKCKKLVL